MEKLEKKLKGLNVKFYGRDHGKGNVEMIVSIPKDRMKGALVYPYINKIVKVLLETDDISIKESWDDIRTEYGLKDNFFIEVVRGNNLLFKINRFNSYISLAKLLKDNGAEEDKSVIKLNIPGIVKEKISKERIEEWRFNYTDEEKEDNLNKVSGITRRRFVKTLAAVVLAGGGYTIYKYETKEPSHEIISKTDLGTFIEKKGNEIGYHKGTDMNRVFLASSVNFDPNNAEFWKNYNEVIINWDNVVPERITDLEGKLLYEKGTNTIKLPERIIGYTDVDAKQWVYNAYDDKNEKDWSEHGDQGKGTAQKISCFAEIIKQEDEKYPGYFAKTGDILLKLDDNFSDNLKDDDSYLTGKFAEKTKEPVKIFYEIIKTRTFNEGRRDKIIADIDLHYIREK